MEITCNRCHQAVPAESCYCPSCGLPQLVYSAEDEDGTSVAAERWPEAVRDAGSIDWRPGMRAALALGVPAGVLSSAISPLGLLGIFWMAGAAAWAVVVYMRSQKPAWITIGAGARIGLVTGLIAGWLAFGLDGAGLLVTRVMLHQGAQIDAQWHEMVDRNEQKTQQWMTQMGAASDAIQESINPQRKLMLSAEGHAGFQTLGQAWGCSLLILFAVGGGALSAKMQARRRRPEV
jgi:hypothetical protein